LYELIKRTELDYNILYLLDKDRPTIIDKDIIDQINVVIK
ncbi:tRNA uridine 5-carboxymethylaminomethyl modification enzyme mnmG, partial [Candidatus Arthromitus sp. SFB-5]